MRLMMIIALATLSYFTYESWGQPITIFNVQLMLFVLFFTAKKKKKFLNQNTPSI
jgi:hypothetical protein